MNRYELEERLIDFAFSIRIKTTKFPLGNEWGYSKDQMIRSSSSAALNYGEAMSAESSKDFIHKNRLVLKELRETFINLKIIVKTLPYYRNINFSLEEELKENNELISIFIKTIQTAQRKDIK